VTAAAGQLVGVALAALVLAFAPFSVPAPALSLVPAVALGAGAGTLLFAALARRARVPPLRDREVVRAVALAAPAVLVAAAAEEILWRFGLLGVLAPLLGMLGAAVGSTLAFALAHAPRNARALASYTATGASFAVVYVATHSILAAIAAHAVYNLLVVAASAAWTEPARTGAPA
jgi:membrane protease YdiL (CAAX protease family)